MLDDVEIEIDENDYDQLDPQILELAQQMGIHPKEVIKHLIELNNQEGGGNEEDQDDEDEGEEDYGLEDEEMDLL